MSQPIEDMLGTLIDAGHRVVTDGGFSAWRARVFASLLAAMGRDEAEAFSNETTGNNRDRRDSGVGYLQGLLVRTEAASDLPESPRVPPAETDSKSGPLKVFLVHGHDSEHKEATARFLERLGLTPIILHEQPNAGRTIIEKFEAHASVQFALILLTPDDTGAAKGSKGAPKPRARQNVIFEFGYFIGALGRSRVCALYCEGVELPSDYQGVLYIPLDTEGAWKTKLAQEFVKASLNIDLKGLL